MDWDTNALRTGVTIISSSHSITAVKQSGDTALTTDSEAIGDDERTTQARLISTNVSDGDLYRWDNTIVTNETPAQTLTRSVDVFVTTQPAPR